MTVAVLLTSFWKLPSSVEALGPDRCTLSSQSKLNGLELIHLRAQRELCAA